ncbi:MAG: tripartite tricarboxylate transporter substrate binding protein [Proteobacteria bacterium]|nr:tripartite tricarboxylate transporter substrate binding protein [Pseudomonadota bacterium]
MRKTLALLMLLAGISSMTLTGPVQAQTWPAKPIRMIVPFPPGGFSDVFGRILAEKFSSAWGQPVVVENRTGGGGNIGAEVVAKSAGDGYTLVMGTVGTHAINASLFSKLPYDPVKDFTPVAFVVEAEGLLVTHPSVPAKTVKELIALAKSRSDLTYGSAGAGTTGHLGGELFKAMAKVDIAHIPYKGNVPAITDLLSGQTSMVFATLPTVLPHVKAEKLRAVAVLGSNRSTALPDLPTVGEAGLPGYEVNNWTGLFAGPGTPAAIVSKMNTEVQRVMRLPEIQARMAGEGLRFMPTTPEQFAAFVAKEVAHWAPVVKMSGAKVD